MEKHLLKICQKYPYNRNMLYMHLWSYTLHRWFNPDTIALLSFTGWMVWQNGFLIQVMLNIIAFRLMYMNLISLSCSNQSIMPYSIIQMLAPFKLTFECCQGMPSRSGPYIHAILLLCQYAQYGGWFGILSIDIPPVLHAGTELIWYGTISTTWFDAVWHTLVVTLFAATPFRVQPHLLLKQFFF